MSHTNEERYLFLRDFFAIHSSDDEAAFSQLARLTGSEFDAAVDSEMDQSAKLIGESDGSGV